MINNQILLGSQSKKDNILNIFKSKPSKEEFSFEKMLNESMRSKHKEEIKTSSPKKSSKTNASSSEKIPSKVVEKNDDKQTEPENTDNGKLIESLQSLFSIIQNLDSPETDINFNHVETDNLKQVEELLNNISSKLLSGEKGINQKDLNAMVDFLSQLENSDLNLSPIINQIKAELKNNLKQTSVPVQNNELKTKLSDGSTQSNINNNINATELEKNWQAVLDENDSLKENFISENKNSKFENETKISVKNEQSLGVEENKTTLNLSNSSKEIIGEENITFKDSKPISYSGIESKQEAPIQKQMFDNILDQVNKAHIHVRENDSEMHLQLKPDNLGSLSLKIAIEKGIVVAKIVAENQVVKETLESNFNLLRDSLNEKGLGVQELSVSVGQNPNFKNRNNFQQFKRFKNIKTNNAFNAVDDISVSNFNNSGGLQNSSIDFLA